MTSIEERIETMSVPSEVVACFLHARSKRPRWLPVPQEYRPRTMEEGYRVQSAVHKALEATGNRRVGYKVGSTSKPGQQSFGLDEPVYAGIFAGSQAPDLATALAPDLISPSVECEIAFCLRSDIDGRDPGISPKEVAKAVGSCHIACEVIDNRYGDPVALGVPSLLADDFFHASFVLGQANPLWREMDLANLDATIAIDDAVVHGHSANVLDALTSLCWLSRKLALFDLALRAGEIVLSGSIVPPTPITLPARSVSLSIAGFASLTLAG
jgi:2-keto-4-pentenoate hydratase